MRICLTCFLSVYYLISYQISSASEEVRQLVSATNEFLTSLDKNQIKVARLNFEDKSREDWHYIPKARKGLAWRDMNEQQKTLSWDIFDLALSKSGMSKTEGVIELEKILWQRSNHSEFRDPGRYHVTIFGNPGSTSDWGASLEGHHLSINLTIADGRKVFVTPSFFGANPDNVQEGSNAGLRPLRGEADQALKLFHMLDSDQQKITHTADKAPREIFTNSKREVRALPELGLPASEMNEAQVTQLRLLLVEYIGRYRAPLVEDDWQKIESAGIEKIYFAWAGSTEEGEPMYYRLQGPTFIMEYVNVQNGSNHSHTVWRDFENDFGRDYLKEHMEEAH